MYLRTPYIHPTYLTSLFLLIGDVNYISHMMLWFTSILNIYPSCHRNNKYNLLNLRYSHLNHSFSLIWATNYFSNFPSATQSLKCLNGWNLTRVVAGFDIFGPVGFCGSVYNLAGTSTAENLPNPAIWTDCFFVMDLVVCNCINSAYGNLWGIILMFTNWYEWVLYVRYYVQHGAVIKMTQLNKLQNECGSNIPTTQYISKTISVAHKCMQMLQRISKFPLSNYHTEKISFRSFHMHHVVGCRCTPKYQNQHTDKNKRTSVIVSNTVRTTRLLSAIVNPYSALIISPMASRLSAWSSLGSVLNAREDDVKMGDEPTVGRIHLNDATEAVVRGMCRESEEIMIQSYY